jgi:hypothetical protein
MTWKKLASNRANGHPSQGPVAELQGEEQAGKGIRKNREMNQQPTMLMKTDYLA